MGHYEIFKRYAAKMIASHHAPQFKFLTQCSLVCIYSTRFKIFVTVRSYPETK